MRWGLGESEKSSSLSDNEVQSVQDYPGSNEAYSPNAVQCPAHMTDRKLLARTDLHVIPFLVLLYWLAFLDRYVRKMRGASE
jgi:hypothetical protein